MKDSFANNRVSTGVEGLDNLFLGDLPRNRMYLLEGRTGTGKTTLALQFLLEGARRGEQGLSIRCEMYCSTWNELLGYGRALTAHARVDDRIRALSGGFDAHVSKPVEPDELIMVVASLANRNTPGRGD